MELVALALACVAIAGLHVLLLRGLGGWPYLRSCRRDQQRGLGNCAAWDQLTTIERMFAVSVTPLLTTAIALTLGGVAIEVLAQ